MSLGIVFKGTEGIVLAADSRVTLTYQPIGAPAAPGAPPQPVMIVSAFYDNATKLLRCAGQDYVAAVTYGLGAIRGSEPRTAHSYIPELEASLAGRGRLSVVEFATCLGSFSFRYIKPPTPARLPEMTCVFWLVVTTKARLMAEFMR